MEQVRVWTAVRWTGGQQKPKEPCTCSESSSGSRRRVLPPGEGQTPEFIGSQGESHCGTRRLEHLGEVFVKQLLVKFVMGQDRVCAQSTGSQPGQILPIRRHLATSRDIFGCCIWEAGATGIQLAEDRDGANHLHCIGQSSQQRVTGPQW